MKVLGVAAGNGAVLFPFRKYLIGNVEPRTAFKTPGDQQWKLNFPGVPLHKDLTLVNYKQVDVIIGHPDCGHSSVLAYSRAKKLSNPKDNLTVDLFHNAIKKFQPKVFLFENLPKFMDSYSREELEEYFCGYRLFIYQGPVTKFGNSQKNRKRLIIIGRRPDTPILLLPKIKPGTLKTSAELIEGLGLTPIPEMGHFTEHLDSLITMYGGYKLPLKEVITQWNTNLKEESRYPTVNRKYTTAPGVYRNLPNEAPNTVRKGNREFDHWGQPMSPRQRARIQGIPDEFKIWYDDKKYTLSLNKGRTTVTKCFPYEISTWFLVFLYKYLSILTK